MLFFVGVRLIWVVCTFFLIGLVACHGGLLFSSAFWFMMPLYEYFKLLLICFMSVDVASMQVSVDCSAIEGELVYNALFFILVLVVWISDCLVLAFSIRINLFLVPIGVVCGSVVYVLVLF